MSVAGPMKALRREPDPQPPGVEAPAAQARVLIVDDDERNAFAASQALEDLGYELVIARSGKEALRRLLESEFAVILLDLHMPDMDGYETARFIRSHPRTKHTPIVFVTAVFRDEAHLFQAYQVGAVDVVFKPVDPFILRAKVSILTELYLKTQEVSRQAERMQALMIEKMNVQEEKLSAERALRRAEARQEAILRSLPIIFHSRRGAPPFAPLFVSEQAEQVTGFQAQRFIDEPAFGLDRVHPDDAVRVARALSSAIETGVYSVEYRWLCADGVYRDFLDQGVLAASADEDEPVIFGSIQDVSDRKTLEDQLTQARKMEAVGQLTGGIAHDFNNLLTVVLGNADMLLRRVDAENPICRQLSAMRQAAARGQALTQQLLAFARRGQLRPAVTDIDRLIADFLPLLQQAVGETIEVSAAPSKSQICVEVDPAHLETALLNLTVNARDAMPAGGRLTIATAQVPQGSAPELADARGYAKIEVRDTGVGMSADVVKHIFEPFFTTKEVGKGSGLGLSQVYGFVQQSGGHVDVVSQPEKGTAFELYLPLSENRAVDAVPTAETEIVGGTETLLVVEDDEAVRDMTVRMLEDLGYKVTTAPTAKAALGLIKRRPRIEGLISDVVMPGGVSGIDLAHAARKLRPTLPVLLTSGYVGDRVSLDPDFPLLDKPYELRDLAARLRDVLENAPGAAGT